MKKLLPLFLLLSLIITDNISAQQEFAPIGATWNYQETYFFSGNIGLVTFTSVGDTIINNKPCRIIYKDNPTCYIHDENLYFHQSNDSIFYYHPVLDIFTPCFIFNAEVGDSWVYQEHSLAGNSDSLRCQVDSISYYPIANNDSLKIQHVSIIELTIGHIGITYQTRLIENIGFEKGFIPFTLLSLCDADYEGNIKCYDDSNIGLVNFLNESCNSTPTIDLDISNIDIYPNPASNFLFINPNETQISKIEIINAQGNIVAIHDSSFSKNQNIEIKIDNFSAGIYFLKIKHNNAFTIKKFVVQD